MAGHEVDEAAVDAVLTASRTLVAVATRSLGAAAEETHRPVPGAGGAGVPRAAADGGPGGALGVTPSTAGRMCDRLIRKSLIRRHRARADRREVQVSITAAGREVVDQATARRRELLAGILARLPARRQAAVAAAFRDFAAAAGEVPDSQWPTRLLAHRRPGPAAAGATAAAVEGEAGRAAVRRKRAGGGGVCAVERQGCRVAARVAGRAVRASRYWWARARGSARWRSGT